MNRKFAQFFNLIWFVLLLLSVSSCKTLTSNRMFSTSSEYEYSSFQESEKEYVIQPYDKLFVKVFSNKGERLIDIKGEVRNIQNPIEYNVEFDGQVKVPTLGRTNLGGLTLREAEQKLEDLYKNYFKDPFVFIEVTNKRVLVFANGSSEGKVVKFSSENFTLIEALAQAGGISYFGKAYQIKLIRGDLTQPEVYKFNIRNLEDIKEVNFQLLTNDIIYVEERPRYASRALQEITPYLSLLTSLFTIYLLVK